MVTRTTVNLDIVEVQPVLPVPDLTGSISFLDKYKLINRDEAY